MHSILRTLYGLYVWSVFLVLAIGTVLVVLVLPGLARRRAFTRAAAALVLRLAGLTPVLLHAERLPQSQCVLVANHASYLDGLVMKAALPPRFGFVIKREMSRVPLAGFLLRRIGSEFVERFDRRKGGADALRVIRTATDGHSLVFFPEGTFFPEPGLRRFHSGAFATATRVGCPLVPAVIRGTRASLPGGSILPRPGRIEIEFLPPIEPLGATAESAAHALREQARAAILDHLDEPDLAKREGEGAASVPEAPRMSAAAPARRALDGN